MRVVIGIDPGPTTSGVVVCTTEGPHIREVGQAHPAMTLPQLRELLRLYTVRWLDQRVSTTRSVDRDGSLELVNPPANISRLEVVIENTTAGPPSTSVMLTTEAIGRMKERADLLRLPQHDLTRAQVLQRLGVKRGRGADARLRRQLINMYGGGHMAKGHVPFTGFRGQFPPGADNATAKRRAVGTKDSPGLLRFSVGRDVAKGGNGLISHAWSALAVVQAHILY